jgi:hypothetical protein
MGLETLPRSQPLAHPFAFAQPGLLRLAKAKDQVSLIENGLARPSIEGVAQPADAGQYQCFARLTGTLQHQRPLLRNPAASRQQQGQERRKSSPARRHYSDFPGS